MPARSEEFFGAVYGKLYKDFKATLADSQSENELPKRIFIIDSTTCFTHFLKTCSESIDFTGLSFENGCPAGIFGHVFAKKEK